MIVHRLGTVEYLEARALQEAARGRVLAGGEDELLLLEHPPVVTLGKRGGLVDRSALAALDTPVIQADRGGLATWHGPGQLVGYPVVDLPRSGHTVWAFVEALGEAMVQVCRDLGVKEARYDGERPGVYVASTKLGAIGLHIHRGVTTHGLALNVRCSLEGFRAIVPCGLQGIAAGTLSEICGRDVPMEEVTEALLTSWPTAASPSPAPPAAGAAGAGAALWPLGGAPVLRR